MTIQLAYSFHLGSDKNKKNSSRNSAKSNVSGTTSKSNNAIQNSAGLTKCDNHNYRKYDDREYDIEIIRGSSSLVDDVKKLYRDEFDEAKEEYNAKQTRGNRKIKDYFTHVSNNSKSDLACEIIIELGDKKYWDAKDLDFKKRMTNVFKQQVIDLETMLPTFKIASAIIHYDETSPHLHIVGVPIKIGGKNGMKKQVGKSDVFTKESLRKLQDKMRMLCIESFNKEYNLTNSLKGKKKGRNRDIDIKDMGDYREIKRQLQKKEERLKEANTQTKQLDNTSNDIDKILDSLKPTLMNKNNMVISNEDVQKIKNYTEDVKDITQTVRSVNDLNMAIRDFEHSAFEIEKENRSLKYEIELKDNEIGSLKKELSTKDKIIGKLQTEKEKLKQELQKFKGFWHSIMSHFHKRICYDKDNNYKIVSDDLYKNGIFDSNDNEIAHNIARRVTIPDENKEIKNKKRNNDTRF